MKTITSLVTLALIAVCMACQGQAKQENVVKKESQNLSKMDTTKQMNLLDEQAKVLGSVLGNMETEDENPFAGITNYLELIDQMEGSNEEKQYLRDQYKLYDLGLDPKKRRSLRSYSTKN